MNATRKPRSPIGHAVAREIVAAYAAWVRRPTDAVTVLRAIELAGASRLSFWDALIVAAAEDVEATEI